jgi:hypothetical protein
MEQNIDFLYLVRILCPQYLKTKRYEEIVKMVRLIDSGRRISANDEQTAPKAFKPV